MTDNTVAVFTEGNLLEQIFVHKNVCPGLKPNPQPDSAGGFVLTGLGLESYILVFPKANTNAQSESPLVESISFNSQKLHHYQLNSKVQNVNLNPYSRREETLNAVLIEPVNRT